MYIWNITNAQTDNSNDITGRPSCQWYSALHKQLLHIHVSSVRLHNDNAWIRSTNSPQVYAGAPPRALRCTFVFSFFLMFFFFFFLSLYYKKGIYEHTHSVYMKEKKSSGCGARANNKRGESAAARRRTQQSRGTSTITRNIGISFFLALSISLSLSLSLSISLALALDRGHSHFLFHNCSRFLFHLVCRKCATSRGGGVGVTCPSGRHLCYRFFFQFYAYLNVI